MVYAIQPIRTQEDADTQKATVRLQRCFTILYTHSFQFLELWAEDPVTAEPEDNDSMEI